MVIFHSYVNVYQRVVFFVGQMLFFDFTSYHILLNINFLNSAYCQLSLDVWGCIASVAKIVFYIHLLDWELVSGNLFYTQDWGVFIEHI